MPFFRKYGKEGRHAESLQNCPRRRRKARFAELSKMREAADREVTGILTNEQLTRLKQIQLWLDRDMALFSAEVIAELKLVSVQTDALTAIWLKYQQESA